MEDYQTIHRNSLYLLSIESSRVLKNLQESQGTPSESCRASRTLRNYIFANLVPKQDSLKLGKKSLVKHTFTCRINVLWKSWKWAKRQKLQSPIYRSNLIIDIPTKHTQTHPHREKQFWLCALRASNVIPQFKFYEMRKFFYSIVYKVFFRKISEIDFRKI